MHFAHLVEQASVTGFCDLFIYGAYMVNCCLIVAGYVLTCADVVPIGSRPQVPTPVQVTHNLKQDMSELSKTIKKIQI